MKGISLPVNVIVIVVVGVLVMVVIAAYFVRSTSSGFTAIELQNAKNNACSILRTSYNCNAITDTNLRAVGAKVNENVGTMTLQQICENLDVGGEGEEFRRRCAGQCGCSIEEEAPGELESP
jgi:hypothetical protein